MNIYQMIAYETARTAFGPWFSMAFRVSSEGVENIPDQGGALLICNHRSVLDPMALMVEIDRYVHFLGGSHGTLLPMAKTLYRMTGMVRLSMKGGARSGKGLGQAEQLMKDGEIVGIFPEGIESFMRPDRASKISYFRTGFARMALVAEVPIIPVAVIPREEVRVPAVTGKLGGAGTGRGSEESPLHMMLYRKMHVRIGKPIDLSSFLEEPLTKNTIDTLSGKLRRIVIKLYNGEDLDRFMRGTKPFDVYTDRV